MNNCGNNFPIIQLRTSAIQSPNLHWGLNLVFLLSFIIDAVKDPWIILIWISWTPVYWSDTTIYNFDMKNNEIKFLEEKNGDELKVSISPLNTFEMLVFVKGLNWNNLRIWRYNLTLYSKIKNWFAHHLLSSSLWQNMYFWPFPHAIYPFLPLQIRKMN